MKSIIDELNAHLERKNLEAVTYDRRLIPTRLLRRTCLLLYRSKNIHFVRGIHHKRDLFETGGDEGLFRALFDY